MRTFKRLIGLISINAILIIGMNFLLAQPSQLKILLKESKNLEYDTLFLGQSHGETSLDPFLYSEKTGKSAFNLCRRMAPVENMFYYLAEANAKEQYGTVIFDIDPFYWSRNHKEVVGSDTLLTFKLTGERSFDYIRNILWKDNFNSAFNDYNFDKNSIYGAQRNIKCKMNLKYFKGESEAIYSINNLIGVGSHYEYRGRGFRYGVNPTGIVWPAWEFDSNLILDENVKAFEKMVEYCNKNKITLVCIQSALPPYRLKSENFSMVHNYFSDLCKRCNVPFYDMNYVKAEFLGQKDSDYVDMDGHMMGELAEKHTAILCDILQSENKEKWFYSDYNDVLTNLR